MALLPFLLSYLLSPVLAALDCRPEGPVVPRPSNLSTSPSFQKAASSFEETLQRALNGTITAGWAVANTSLSLAVVSADHTSPSTPLWEFHHLARNNVDGTRELTRDTQYLVGSVSKVFSDLVLLKSGLDLDDPVTDYLPQLKETPSLISWGNISLRALGSQLSGVPSNYGFSEYYFLKDYMEDLGFPLLNDTAFPPCGVIGLNEACTRDELLEGMLRSHAITAPMERPAYSNIAFTILILAIEEATGKNYSNLIHELVAEPLGLKNTFPSPGNSSKAVIPPVDNNWGSDYGLNAPGGGLVSSLSDLSSLCHGILSRTVLPTSETRQWLKPHSLAGSHNSLVGLPWEIYRPPSDDLVPDHPHPVTVFAKSGGANGYRSQLAVVDEYGIAVVLLSAGDVAAAVPYVYDAMLATFVPAVDAAAREQADELTGVFASGGPMSTNNEEQEEEEKRKKEKEEAVCIEAEITQDEDSLLLSSLTRNGSDILSAITEIWALTIGSQLSPINRTFRIFPTEEAVRDETPRRGEQSVIRESWRLWLSPVYGEASDLPGRGLGSHDCTSWTLNDWVYYGSEPVDRFVVARSAETRVVIGVEFPFLRSGLLSRVGMRGPKESCGL